MVSNKHFFDIAETETGVAFKFHGPPPNSTSEEKRRWEIEGDAAVRANLHVVWERLKSLG